jgi:hypothetical protein
MSAYRMLTYRVIPSAYCAGMGGMGGMGMNPMGGGSGMMGANAGMGGGMSAPMMGGACVSKFLEVCKHVCVYVWFVCSLFVCPLYPVFELQCLLDHKGGLATQLARDPSTKKHVSQTHTHTHTHTHTSGVC